MKKLMQVGNGKLSVKIETEVIEGCAYPDTLYLTNNGWQWNGLSINKDSAKMIVESLNEYMKLNNQSEKEK